MPQEIAKCVCGASARAMENKQYRWVQCNDAACWLGPMEATERDAINAWNKLMEQANAND